MAKRGLILAIISCLLLLTPNVEADKKKKLLKLELYVHDLVEGNSNPTVYEVARASISADSPTRFGIIHVVDDLVTAAADINSKAVGRFQGLTTFADMSITGIMLTFNFVFTAGRFNGSTIAIFGRNEIRLPERELTVAGGTGVFRFAQGYAKQSAVFVDRAAAYGVYKYVVYTTYDAEFRHTEDVESVIAEKFDVEIAEM